MYRVHFSSPIVTGDGPAPGDAQPTIDASPVDGDRCDSGCKAAGGSCDRGTCVITTTAGDVTCPAGLPCRVVCNASGACEDIVDCTQATQCTIDCAVSNSCNAADFDCRGPGCTVYCRALNTCNATTIDVHSSSCALECCALNTCMNDFATPEVCSFGTTCP